MQKSNLAVHFSSASDDWETPQETFDRLNAKYGPFNLDACATSGNKKCDQYYSPADDSLRCDWSIYDPPVLTVPRMHLPYSPGAPIKRVYMNPPYGRGIGAWVKKAYEEAQKGCLVVCLLPARTDTKWFHDYCTKGEIEFIRGRLKFGGAKNSAPFPSMVVVFRPKEGQ